MDAWMAPGDDRLRCGDTVTERTESSVRKLEAVTRVRDAARRDRTEIGRGCDDEKQRVHFRVSRM